MIGLRTGLKAGIRAGAAVGVGADPLSFAPSTPAPTIVALGTADAGVGALTPGLPAGIAVGDILWLNVNNTFTTVVAATLSDAQGFVAATGAESPSGDFGGIRAFQTGFWRRYDGTGSAPTVADNGEYSVARIVAIRGCASSGDPWDEILVDGDNDGASTMTMEQSGETSGANRLVVTFVGAFTQASSEVLGGWVCAELSSVTELASVSYALGEDVYWGAVSGVKATPGAYGDLTADWSGSGAYWVSSGVTVAFKP